jgi:hypothetical protein
MAYYANRPIKSPFHKNIEGSMPAPGAKSYPRSIRNGITEPQTWRHQSKLMKVTVKAAPHQPAQKEHAPSGAQRRQGPPLIFS